MYGNIIDELNLQKLSISEQLFVWSNILGRQVELGEYITSPFRQDNVGSCYLAEYNRIIYFTDWAFKEYNKYTCIQAVMHFGYSYSESINKIYQNLKYSIPIFLNYNIPLNKNSKKKLFLKDNIIEYKSYTYRDEHVFTKKTQEYWKLRGVTLNQLYEDGVRSVKEIKSKYYIIYPTDPSVIYTLDNQFKLYNPYGHPKWLSTITKEKYWKWCRNSDKLIITKSYKDGRIIFNNSECDVYAFQNEGIIPDNLNLNYKKIIIIYDNDFAGIHAANELQTYLKEKEIEAELLFFTSGKDADEVYLKGNLGKELRI